MSAGGRSADASLGLAPKPQTESVDNMFSITCAQKMAKIKTIPSELEAWEQRRREASSVIQERLRHERSSKAVFPRGYGPAGRVPKYVKAHIGLLEESPLARPVFSPGRRIQPSACRRRPQSATATGAAHHTKPNRATAVKPRPQTAHGRRFSNAQSQLQRKRAPASCPLLLGRPAAGAADSRSTLEAGGRVRPTTAPCERPATAPCESPRRRRDLFGSRKNTEGTGEEEEARLVEKMAQLSDGRRGGEFPTVAALKTAVALRALQAQLRECRASNLSSNPTSGVRGGGAGSSGGDGADQKRAVSAPISSNPAAADGNGTPAAPRVRSRSARRRRRGREQRELKPWDNRSPFVVDNASPSRSTRPRGSPTSPAAPVLRTLTRDDPVFGCVKAPPSTPPPHPDSPTTTSKGRRLDQNGEERAASSPSAAPVAQEAQIQACFRRLTVDALVELSHLRNPTKPVLAVLAGLGCLLGWKQHKKILSSKQDRHHPPRSLFSNVYVLRDVLASVCPRQISNRRLSAIKARLGVPEAAAVKVRSANAAAWVLLEWLLSVVACARSAGGSA